MFGKDITAQEAKMIIVEQNGILLDIRTKEEYEERHIEGCEFIPLNVLGHQIEDVIEDYDRPIILYCRSGQRTKVAAVVLKELGYTQLYDLGGMNNWFYNEK
ncbi:MAG: rhodanese-like domain-containing protein [Cellulosilyticaceae bacterium]